jgi:ABC-type phosphate transport system substrate-binding protein
MSKILLLLLALVTPQDRVSAQQSSFVVVVNAANSVQSLKADQVSKYFLKKVGQWDGGIRVLPVELSETLAARQEFTKSVHKKPLSAVKSFWQQQVFSGRDVRANPGAIGYVSSAATLGSGIKTVTISEK